MENELINIKGHEGYVRDKKTGAVLNINKTEISLAKERKLARRKKESEYQSMKQDVNELKKDMNEIKDLLGKIVERV